MKSKKENEIIFEKGYNELFKSSMNIVISIYILLIMCIFPLYTDDMYFNVLEAKFRFFKSSSLMALSVIALLIFIYFLVDGIKHKFSGIKYVFSFNRIKKSVSHTDIFFSLFIIVMTISLFISGYYYECWWGRIPYRQRYMGRFEGLFLWLMLYIFYILITRFYKFKKWHLNAFLITGLLMAAWGISDFFRMDVFGFLSDVADGDKTLYVSSIGNINTYTGVLSLYLGLATVLFIFEEGKYLNVFYFIAMLITIMAMISGISDNAVLSVGALFSMLPFIAWRSKTGFRRYLISLASLFTLIRLRFYISKSFYTIADLRSSAFYKIGESKIAGILAIIFIALSIYFYLKKEKSDKLSKNLKSYRKAWFVFLIFVFITVSVLLVLTNTGHIQKIADMDPEIFIFNDAWGNNRGYAWKVSLRFIKEKAKLLQVFFGTGPDTFGIMTVDNYKKEMIDVTHTIFDCAHNVYLDYLVTLGILGLITYIGTIISGIKGGFKCENKYIHAIIYAVLIYSVQAIVNLEVIISTPIFMILYIIGINLIRKEKDKSL